MKTALLTTAAAAFALMGGAALAQSPQTPKPPTPGSVTGDWNGAHAPSDDQQYTKKVVVPVGASNAETADAAPVDTAATVDTTAAVAAPAAGGYAQSVSVTTTTVTNGPVADTPENRAKYGSPMSRAGKRTAARGN